MIKKIALCLCILMILPFATGCMDSLKFWDKKKEVELVNKKLPPFEALFNRTVELYNNKQYKEAVNSFLFLRENYPGNTVYQSRITLYLADSHYKLKEYPEALVSYRDFIKFYPKNPDIPYAWFQIGMCNYKQKRTYDRDASFTRKGMDAFKKVLEVSSPGVLTNEAIRMIAYCQRDLALHEIFVADFYYRTHHYESAIYRFNDILETYKNIRVGDRAHLGIAKSYLKLKEKAKALPHLGFVARYYPLTPSGKTAWKILGKTYNITSRSQLPDTSQLMKQSAKKLPSKKQVCPPPQKGTRAKKAAAPATSRPASGTTNLKPQVYLPTITKEQENPPVVYSTPAKKEKVPVAASKPVSKPAAPSGKIKSGAEKTANPVKKKAEVIKSQPVKPVSPEKKAPIAKLNTPAPAPKKLPLKKSATKPVAAKKVQKTPPPPATALPAAKTAAVKPVEGKPIVKKSEEKPVSKPAPIANKSAQKEKKPAAKKVIPSQTPAPTPIPQKKTVKKVTPPPAKKKAVEKSADTSGLVGAMDTRLPINITSDHVIAKQGKNYVKFKGNVIAKQKNVTLACESLTAFYTKGGKAIDKIVAKDNVTITQLNKKVRCGKATFYNAKRKIVLENSPRAWDGNNKLSGDKMILLLKKNEIRVLGSSGKPTELVIYPDKKP